MRVFEDVFKRKVRLTDERYEHLVSEHPEMVGLIDKVKESFARSGHGCSFQG